MDTCEEMIGLEKYVIKCFTTQPFRQMKHSLGCSMVLTFNIQTTIHDLKTTTGQYDSRKVETTELSIHAGLDEHRHRVWCWDEMVASVRKQCDLAMETLLLIENPL